MAGEHNPYQEYRTSNTGWLDDVPSTWSNARMDDIALTIRDQVSPKDIASLQVMHYSIPIIQVTGTGQEEDGSTIDSNKFQVKEGDVLFSKLNPRKQTITTVRSHYQPVVASTEFIVLRLKLSDQRFVQYLLYSQELKSFVCSQVESATKSHQRIHPSVISKLKLALPTEDERAAIANFLDHETAKIDALIEKQQQLIKLLKEKRQAVISHAVTKGLNPTAPMRDSGVEWLGEVPEHWEVKKLKHVVSEPLMYGANEAALDINHDNPRFVRITDVKGDGSLKDDTFRSLSEELAEPYLLSEADILLARTGGTVGKSFLYSESWGRCCFAGYLIKASLDQSKVRAEWLYQYTKTQYYWEWIASSQIQATLPNVSADKYNGFLMAVPPDQEQNEILNKLRIDVDRFNELVSKAESAIGLMQERRTALISAAVTGKIDVRNWQAPQPSNKSNNNTGK